MPRVDFAPKGGERKAHHPWRHGHNTLKRYVEDAAKCYQLAPEIEQQFRGGKGLQLLSSNVPDIAKGRPRCRRIRAVDEQHPPPCLRQRPSNGAPNDASPDDGDIWVRPRSTRWDVSHA